MTKPKQTAATPRSAWKVPNISRIAGSSAQMPGLVALIDEGLAKGS